jgi:hypothetical protein
MIGHHPAVGQVYTLLELDCQHFGVYLHDDAFQPIMYTLAAFVMIA